MASTRDIIPSTYDERFQFWLGLVVGLDGAAMCGCVLGWWHDSAFVTSHETLVAGILAVIAAWIPVAAVAFQVRETCRIAAQTRAGRAMRARALLSQQLSDVYDYAKACIRITEGMYDPINTEIAKLPSPPEPLPLLPMMAMAAIGEAIENAERRPAQALAHLLEKLQVQRSRQESAMNSLYRQWPETLVLARNLDDYTVDAIELIACCNSTFRFARLTSEEIEEPDADMMAGAAREARIFEEDRPGIYDIIRQRWGPYRPPTRASKEESLEDVYFDTQR